MSEKVTVQDLLEAGVHFGHQVKRWNPKMKEFVFGVRNGIHIIDLTKTMQNLADSCNFLQHLVCDGGDIIFVGTKRQAQEIVKEAATNCEMYHISERWLGGLLTNNHTIRKSITKMRSIERDIESNSSNMSKKELSSLSKKLEKLHRNLDGISELRKLPAALVVVDINNEDIAVKEAKKMKIPVIGIVDTNGNPDTVDYPIPANDDAIRSIRILVSVISDSVKVASDLYKKKLAEEKEERAKKRAEEAKERENEKAGKESTEKRTEEKKIPVKKKVVASRTITKKDDGKSDEVKSNDKIEENVKVEEKKAEAEAPTAKEEPTA